MADSKAAIRKTLKEASNVCKTSLALLPEPYSQSSSASSSTVKITAIHESLPPIYVDLLQSIRTHITSTSLSFSPPITPDGALSYLPKAQDAIARLASCVVAAAGDDKLSARESVLVEEWASVARRVIENVLALLQAYAEHLEQATNWVKASKSTEKTLPDVKQATAPYLSNTASVWDTIDSSLKTVSGTEAQAAQRRWAMDSEAMTDAWTEYSEMLEDAEEVNDDDDEADGDEDEVEGDDDEWAGLEKDLMGGGKLSAEELARATEAKPVLQLTRLLHRSVSKALPSHPFSFRPLLASSTKLSAAYDDAISTLYAPQQPDEVSDAFDELVSSAKAVAALFGNGDGSLEDDMARLNVNEAAVADRRKVGEFLAKWSPKMNEAQKTWIESVQNA